MRRIVALTGSKAIAEMQNNSGILNKLQKMLNVPPKDLTARVEGLLNDKKALEKKLKTQSNEKLDIDILDDAQKIGDYSILVKKVGASDIDSLKAMGDNIFNKLHNGVAVLLSEGEEKPLAVIVVSKNLNQEGILAGSIAKDVGGIMGGGGGGKPHLATAGGKENAQLDDVVNKIKNLLIKILDK